MSQTMLHGLSAISGDEQIMNERMRMQWRQQQIIEALSATSESSAQDTRLQDPRKGNQGVLEHVEEHRSSNSGPCRLAIWRLIPKI